MIDMLKNLLKLIVNFLIWFFQPPIKKPTGSIVYPSIQPVDTLIEDLPSDQIVEEPTEIKNTEEEIDDSENHETILTIENILYFEERFLPSDQYVNEYSNKIGIVLHHTVSRSDSVEGDIKWWKSNKERVGTHFIVDKFGNIYQCVPLDKWIHHLGVTMSSNRISFRYRTNELNDKYNSQTIGIELDSAGGLISRNNKWISSYNRQIPEKDVWKTKNYRGYTGFEIYHPAQLESLKKLILYLIEKYPVIKEGLNNDFTKIFDINLDALNSKPGIYSHTSYRTDKSDCAPQPELIKMLNSLKDEVRSNSSEA